MAQEKIFRHLHGDGTASRLNTAGGNQLGSSPEQANGVNPRVGIKAIILGRHKGMDQLLWYLFEFHGRTTLVAVLGNQQIILRIDA